MDERNRSPQESSGQLEIDLLALVRALFGRWMLLAGLIAVGIGAGLAAFMAMPKVYQSTVSFAFQGAQGGTSRLQQLAMLAGSMDMKQDNSPFLSHLESFAETREVTNRIAGLGFGDSTVIQILTGLDDISQDTFYSFHSKLTSMYEIKKKDGIYNLTFKSQNPRLAKFLTDSLFQAITLLIEEKRRKSVGKKLEFVSDLVDKYRGQYNAASERMKDFLMRNVGATSPELLMQRGNLALEQKVEEEKYLFAIKEQEELRIQHEQDDLPLVVMEGAFLAQWPTSPSKSRCLLLSVIAFLMAHFAIVALWNRRDWIRKT